MCPTNINWLQLINFPTSTHWTTIHDVNLNCIECYSFPLMRAFDLILIVGFLRHQQLELWGEFKDSNPFLELFGAL